MENKCSTVASTVTNWPLKTVFYNPAISPSPKSSRHQSRWISSQRRGGKEVEERRGLRDRQIDKKDQNL